jgi:hypothetical protein
MLATNLSTMTLTGSMCIRLRGGCLTELQRYMVCPEETIADIWREYKMDSRRQRREYGVDDLAFAMKAAVVDWAYTNIRTPVSDFSSDLHALYTYLVGEATFRGRYMHR